MARLLCVWEQGGQLGHLNRLKLPIEVALQMGHEVFLAARELRHVKSVLGDLPVTVLQAPFKQNIGNATADQFLSYTHLIARHCFADANELDSLERAWHSLFELVQPQAVLFEHSPTALVAALPFAFEKILIGQGFGLPPEPPKIDSPLAPFPTTQPSAQVFDALRADDDWLLAQINSVLAKRGVLPLGHLFDIFAQVQHTLCMSWPALDPFGPRAMQYMGATSLSVDRAPVWPAGDGAKVFGYLQLFPALEQLLKDLLAANVCALLYVRDAPQALVQAYTEGSVQIITQMVDMQRISAQADWVISHANHSTTATVALAGVPQLLIPRQQEQLFMALRLARQGSAVVVFQDQTGFSNAITAMQSVPGLKVQAELLQADMSVLNVADAGQAVRDVFVRTLGESPARISPTFTFITTCKGRLHHLKQSLPFVASVPGIEVVVVDYDCPDGTALWVAENFPQVRVVKVDNAPHFNVGRARNLGAQSVQSDWLVFFDADVCLQSSFFEWLNRGLDVASFYRANGGKSDLIGTCVIPNTSFQALGGYDDVFTGWGGEDIDLYRMLRLLGNRQSWYVSEMLVAVEHGDDLRTLYSKEKDIDTSVLIQDLYAKFKADVSTITQQLLTLEQRRTLHKAVSDAVTASMGANFTGHGEEIRIDLPLQNFKLRTTKAQPVAASAYVVYQLHAVEGKA